jgi:zinc protease
MLDRKLPPPFNRSVSFDLIQPTTITLTNGLDVHFVSGGDQEVIKIEFIFNAGRWLEESWGVSHFTSNLLTKGTKHKSSFDIAQIFDLYGSHIEVSPGLDGVTLSLYTLTKDLEPVLQLLYEILTEPTFPGKELQQSKDIYIQNLKINQEKTSFQASKLIRKNIFGEHHPYGKELDESDVISLQKDQLVNFYQKAFADFRVIISGKISAPSQQLIIKTLSSLKISTPNKNISRAAVSSNKNQHVNKADSVQTSIRVGSKSLLRNHPDYIDVLFLNHVLGGYFGSRLMKNIREEKGLTYGIHSSIHSLKHDSFMVIGADVDKENRDLALGEIRNELKRLRSEKIGIDELDTARYHFIGSLQAEITTPFAHADKIKTILLHNLDPQHYKKIIKRIDAVKGDELVTTAEKYFNEENFIEVSVG